MMQPFDPVIYRAYERLLAQPDPPEMPHRGSVALCTGEANRRITRYPHILNHWLQQRHMDTDGEQVNGEKD